MIVPSITRQAFIDIAESIIKGMTPVDLDRCFCFLRKRYGLYENESKVLAIIYTRSDHLATVPNICNYLLIIDSEAKCILENLRDMGYIEEQRSLSWGTTVFRISPAFMEAVSTDRPLSEVKDSTPYDKFVQVITSLLDLKTKPPYPPPTTTDGRRTLSMTRTSRRNRSRSRNPRPTIPRPPSPSRPTESWTTTGTRPSPGAFSNWSNPWMPPSGSRCTS